MRESSQSLISQPSNTVRGQFVLLLIVYTALQLEKCLMTEIPKMPIHRWCQKNWGWHKFTLAMFVGNTWYFIWRLRITFRCNLVQTILYSQNGCFSRRTVIDLASKTLIIQGPCQLRSILVKIIFFKILQLCGIKQRYFCYQSYF